MEMNDTPQDKYLTALAKYNTQLNDADVQAQVAALIDKKSTGEQYGGGKKIPFQLY